jgi:hypothetical protein
MSKSHFLAVAAATLVALGAGATPALASGPSPLAAPTVPTPAQLAKLDSTPLGAAIERQDKLIQENVSTAGRKAIAQLTANHTACEKAVKTVAAVAAQPGGRPPKIGQPEIKREWLKGVRLLANGDLQLAAYFRASDKHEGSMGKLHTALTNLDYGDLLTGWAFNALIRNPGPLPKRHRVH